MKDESGSAAERVLVMGTGALGAFYGGRLAQAGVDVVFVARGATLAALRSDGLVIESAHGVERVAPVRAVATPAEAGPCSVVLVCVKSYDTDAAIAALRPVVGSDTIVLSLQNGIENEERLAAGLGLPPLLAGMTQIGAELVAPGVVRVDSGGRIVFGELDGRATPRAARLAALFAGAGIDHRLARRIAVMLWDKLAWNAAFNAATAVTRRTVGEVLADPDGSALVRAAMLEVVAVAQASGVPLAAEKVDEALRHSAAELGMLKTSMLQDLELGRPMEIQALLGVVVELGDLAEVNTPLLDAILALVAQRAKLAGCALN